MKKSDDTALLTAEAFWTILASGSKPTIDLVNGWMVQHNKGTRRRNDISDALKDCWEALAKRAQLHHAIPGIPDDTVQLVIQLRDRMVDLARAEFATDVVEINARADARVAQAQTLAQQADNKAVKAHQALASAGEELAKAGELQRNTEQRWAVAEDALLAEKDAHHAARIRVAELEATSSSLATELATAQRTHAAALQAEGSRFSEMQRTLLLQVDDAKTQQSKLVRQLEKLDDRLNDKIRDAAARERELTEQSAQLRAELGLQHGTVAALNKQLADLQMTAHEMAVSTAELTALTGRQDAENDRLTRVLHEIELRRANLIVEIDVLHGRVRSELPKKAAMPSLIELLDRWPEIKSGLGVADSWGDGNRPG